METYLQDSLKKNKSIDYMDKLEPLEKEFVEFMRTDLTDLAVLFSCTKLGKLKVETDNVEVAMRKKKKIKEPQKPAEDFTQATIDRKFKPVTSKHLGILHLNNKKGAPYAKIDDMIERDQVLGTVETMNILSEIKADRAGKLAEILESDGKPVEYGQILFVLEVE